MILKQEPHPFFKRDGQDLVCIQKITLVDALCGCSFYIRHLDGRFLHISHAPGNVIKPGDVKAVEGEGVLIIPFNAYDFKLNSVYMMIIDYFDY